ncbi:MAG: hypothetical protein ACE5HI_14355 [bacterium]
MFSNIPQSRIILYLIIAGLVPIVFVATNLISKKNKVENLHKSLEYVKQFALDRKGKQSSNVTVIEHYKESDHFYIDKHLETLSFLDPEIETLQKIVNNKYFAGDENIKKRLEFLTGPGNALRFSEESVQTYPPGKKPVFQETTASLVQKVELNLTDLKELLSLIEGEPIGPFKPGPNRPQFIILDFKLDKKEVTKNNDIFQLNMKLLKREYL